MLSAKITNYLVNEYAILQRNVILQVYARQFDIISHKNVGDHKIEML